MGFPSLLFILARASACPCSHVSFCEPVSTPLPRVEIFGFSSATAGPESFDLKTITTIAWNENTTLLCAAHEQGVRVVASHQVAGNLNITALGRNSSLRAVWIKNLVDYIEQHFLDGVTFDFEGPLAPNANEIQWYSNIVKETKERLREKHRFSQVSVCAAWSPDCIDGRCYDYKQLAAGSDFLYVMGYDTRSQIFDECTAYANAALPLIKAGLARYLEIGVEAEKLVLGVPWYGYDYRCLNDDPRLPCNIKKVPFRGVNCSDAAGSEVSFAEIIALVDEGKTGGAQWNGDSSTPFYNYISSSDGHRHQRWYDDNISTALKYDVASDLRLRGVGPFTYDDLAYATPSAKRHAHAMWQALSHYKMNTG